MCVGRSNILQIVPFFKIRWRQSKREGTVFAFPSLTSSHTLYYFERHPTVDLIQKKITVNVTLTYVVIQNTKPSFFRGRPHNPVT